MHAGRRSSKSPRAGRRLQGVGLTPPPARASRAGGHPRPSGAPRPPRLSGKVRATGSEKRPDSISSPISPSAWTARPAVTAAERHPVLPRPPEVGDRDDMLGAAGELDELRQHSAPGDVERHIDAVGCERANPVHKALAVGDGLGPERAEILVVHRAGGADHARAARPRQAGPRRCRRCPRLR